MLIKFMRVLIVLKFYVIYGIVNYSLKMLNAQLNINQHIYCLNQEGLNL